MADTLILIPQDDEAERILDEFEDQTGLQPDQGDDDARVYALEGEDHRVEVVQALTDIDEDWSEHVTLGSPA
jgi:hypothetical protein